MKMIKAVYLFCAVLAIVLAAGCQKQAVGQDMPSAMEAVVPGEMPQADEIVHEVRIVDNKFVPETIEINAGDTVQWVNMDNMKHTISFENDAIFDEEIGPNARISFSTEEKGTYDYSCTIHPGMRGRIIVN